VVTGAQQPVGQSIVQELAGMFISLLVWWDGGAADIAFNWGLRHIGKILRGYSRTLLTSIAPAHGAACIYGTFREDQDPPSVLRNSLNILQLATKEPPPVTQPSSKL